MKKTLITLSVLAILFTVSGYIFYKVYVPKMMVSAMVANQLPGYIPKNIQTRIEEFRKPVNASAEEMIEEMHKAEIPLEKVLNTIDNASEVQIYMMLDELTVREPMTTNEVFNIGKKHFPVEYDVEAFRKPFNDNVNMRMIRKAIEYANMNRQSEELDIDILKEIAKKILIQKEKEYRMRAEQFKVRSSKFEVQSF